MIRYACYRFSFGSVTIGYEDDAVVFLKIGCDPVLRNSPSSLTDLAAQQLREYFGGTRNAFTFPIRLHGTDFQKAVWEELGRIPYGETRTYGQIAAAIGNPKAARAIGQAVNKNPIWIAVPCHRIIGKHHELTGYAGGLELKQKLLDLEQNITQ